MSEDQNSSVNSMLIVLIWILAVGAFVFGCLESRDLPAIAGSIVFGGALFGAVVERELAAPLDRILRMKRFPLFSFAAYLAFLSGARFVGLCLIALFPLRAIKAPNGSVRLEGVDSQARDPSSQ